MRAKRGGALDQCRPEHAADEGEEEAGAVLQDDVVDEEFRGRGEHETRDPVDRHQKQAESQQRAAGADERPQIGPDGPGTSARRAFGAPGRRYPGVRTAKETARP